MENVIVRSFNEEKQEFIYFVDGLYYIKYFDEKSRVLCDKCSLKHFKWSTAERSIFHNKMIMFENDIFDIVEKEDNDKILDVGIFNITDFNVPGFYLLDDINEPSFVEKSFFDDDSNYKIIGNIHTHKHILDKAE